MAAELQNIPIFVLEHKWSSDIESNVYSDVEDARGISLLDYSKIQLTRYLYCTFSSNVFSSAIIFLFLHQKSDDLFFILFLSIVF